MNVKNLKLKFNMSKIITRELSKINKIVLHHRAGNGDIESIHEQHLKRGWAGVGYHFYIRKDGTIYQGRPVEYVGSHCPSNNTNSIGICFEGNFTKEVPTLEQIKVGKELVKELRTKYKTIKRVFNHRDLCKTLCPATDLVKILEV